MTNNETPSEKRLFALLIGIDEYLAERALSGCVNDVDAMRILLQNRYGVPDERIRVLTNTEATRDNILRAFEEHLINNPDIQRGDQILFHYCGHGSQMQAGPGDYEPDGMNETLVPHDSRTADVYDIPDKTVAGLLERLAEAKGDQVTVILDCCHSGSGTRGPEAASPRRVRRVPADLRVPPADLDADIRSKTTSATRSVGIGGGGTQLPYVLLAGCLDREESNEHYGNFGDTAGAWHGALTFFLLQSLRMLPEGATYRELHERVAPLVNVAYPKQTPQCEGDRDRRIFDGVRVERDPFVTVLRVAPDQRAVTLGAGVVHGLHPGTQLALYPAEVRTRAEIPAKPIATVEVVSATATVAEASVQGQPSAEIPSHARAVITVQADGGLRKSVRLEAGDDAAVGDVLAKVRSGLLATAGGNPSPYLRIEDDPDVPVDFVVKADDGHLGVFSDTDTPLIEPLSIAAGGASDDLPSKVIRAMESIARFHTVQNLSNDSGSSLNGKVRLGLRRYINDASGKRAEDLPSDAVSAGGELTIYFDPDDDSQNLYVVDVFNESDVAIYPHVFALSPDYSIRQLYPSTGQQEAVEPGTGGQPYPIGLQPGTSTLDVYLNDGWDASRDFLKAIATTEPTDIGLLVQDGLSVPAPRSAQRSRGTTRGIQQLIDAVAFGDRKTRFARPYRPVADQDWTTAQLSFNTVRKYRSAQLEPQRNRVSVGDELTVIAPDGFAGEITVTTVGSATRGALGDSGLRPPPGLARIPEAFQLVGPAATRGLGSTGFVVGLDIDEESRKLITPDNPLRLNLPALAGTDPADVWPVIFDGEDYLLGGHGSEAGDAVELVSLPRPVVPTDSTGRPTTRGIGRTLRLFIFKKLGRHTPELGLRRAEVRDGEVHYGPVKRDEFRPGQRVAVFVHGFLSDSRWMIESPAPFLRREVAPYDHFLTWDYETFGTSVETHGGQLAQALRQQCGLEPDDDISVDVYAHSMGTLVTRCMIELSGGHTFVDRAVLAGPPNRGSTLATTGRMLPFLVTELVNRAAAIPILGAASWTLNQLFEQGVGLADLAVDSPIVAKLNALDAPSNVPYLVLAGENRLDPEGQNRLRRLASKVLDAGLDTVFGEQNDIAIGLSSLQGLRHGTYPRLTTEILPCDHFHYYAIQEGQRAIVRWASGLDQRGDGNGLRI